MQNKKQCLLQQQEMLSFLFQTAVLILKDLYFETEVFYHDKFSFPLNFP